jgi:hypothetical protein
MDKCLDCKNKAINYHGYCPDHVPDVQVRGHDMIKQEFDPKCLICDSFVTSIYEFDKYDQWKLITINKRKMFTYCDKHQCKVTDCVNPCYFNKKYCILHKCQVSDCIQIRKDKKYCSEHGCKFCNKVNINIDSKVCINHKCGQSNCLNDLYCQIHWCMKCENTRCDHQRTHCKTCFINISSENNYCIIHRCCFSQCNECVSDVNKFYCNVHRCKSYDTLKINGESVKCQCSINCRDKFHSIHNKMTISEYIQLFPKDIQGIILLYSAL